MCRDDMLEDMRRGGEAQAAQASMAKLNLDQQPPRILGAPAQNYPPGQVNTVHYALCTGAHQEQIRHGLLSAVYAHHAVH